jgi:hypothetical protein
MHVALPSRSGTDEVAAHPPETFTESIEIRPVIGRDLRDKLFFRADE